MVPLESMARVRTLNGWDIIWKKRGRNIIGILAGGKRNLELPLQPNQPARNVVEVLIWIGNIAPTVGGCGNLQMGGKYESNRETSYVNVSNSTR